MKIVLLPLMLFTGFFFAQRTLLTNPISESVLTSSQKVPPSLAKTYNATYYFAEHIDDLEQNFTINLPRGKNISAIFQKTMVYSNNSFSGIYKIAGDNEAELVFSKSENAVTGMYASGGEKIIFQQVTPLVLAVSYVNEQMLINQDNKNDTVEVPGFDATSLTNPNVCTAPVCGDTTIDVMVLYTGDAKNAYGGTSQSNSFIATAITNFNTALQNAGVSNVTINLVYAGEIAYTESGNINTDLSRLRTSGDGFMDNAQTLRSLYGADLVALITASPTNTCGLGYVNTNPTNYSNNSAYSVTIFSCVVSNYSMSHEMGHNMGLNHDWYVNTNVNPCRHHHGYVNRSAVTGGTSSPTSARWRTIMAYNDECSDLGFTCSRKNLWSNPNITYNSEPTGLPLTDEKPSFEAYGFERFACVVSEFMPSVTLGAKGIVTDNFAIYPNPVKDRLTIKTNLRGDFTFAILSASGQQIAKSKSKTISVTGFSAGLYFLVIYDANGDMVGTKRFVVE